MRTFSGENEDGKEYRRWRLWVANKLLTLDKLAVEARGAYVFTLLSGKALEAVEHVPPGDYQKKDGEQVLFGILDRRFPDKDSSDELAETLNDVFAMRVKDGESLRQWISRSTELFDKCERKANCKFPAEARGYMMLKYSGLSDEQQAVVKGRALGDLKLETISKAMRSVYPDFVYKRRTAVAVVEDSEADLHVSTTGEVQGFEDVEAFLTDFVQPDDNETAEDEHFEESEVAEILATTWKDKRQELSRLQRARKFTDAGVARRSFRVEIEELKKRTKCNRCGRVGHWARECRQGRDGGSASGKGKGKSSEAAVNYVEQISHNDEISFVASVMSSPTMLQQLRDKRQCEKSDLPSEIFLVSSPGYGVLDSGCGKTIIGRKTLEQFQPLWRDKAIQFPKYKKETNVFRFGNGHQEVSDTVAELPVGIGGRRGVLQAALVEGDAPLLISRPALKSLGAELNFAADSLRLFKDKVEVPLITNSAGQYVVNVLSFAPGTQKVGRQSCVAEVAVAEVQGCEPEHASVIPDIPIVPPDNPIGPHSLSSNHNDNLQCNSKPIDMSCQSPCTKPSTEVMSVSKKQGGITKKQLRSLKSQVKKASRPLGTKYDVVEVFSPPRFTLQAEEMGLRGLAVDIKQGWDLTDSTTQDRLADELDKHPPELLVICPPCTDAGGWFNLNSCYMSLKEVLRRKLQLKKFLSFCKRLIAQQIRHGGRFMFEHPKGSSVWKDDDMDMLCQQFYKISVDMCQYNLHLPACDQQPKQLIRKPTSLLVSHHDMTCLERVCPGPDHPEHQQHAVIAGQHKVIGSVSRHAGKYTPEFVSAVMKTIPSFQGHEVLIVDDDLLIPQQLCHEVLAAEAEAAEAGEGEVSQEAKEAEEDEAKIKNTLMKLHKNLSHPSTNEFIRVLRHGQASEKAISLAKQLKCPLCESKRPPAVPPPAQTSRVVDFNQRIGIDVKHLQGWQLNQKVKALNIVDQASSFQLMIPFFETETADVLRRLLNDRWIAWAGNPREIVMDPAKTNLGKALTEPMELEGTHISTTAAAAHWQLGKTEVHGGLFAKVLSKVLEERQPTNQAEWLDCVRQCHVKNSTIQTFGFSPCQHVFGRNPILPGDLLTEPQLVIPCTASLQEDSLSRACATRASARKALIELQDSKGLRRALAARSRRNLDFKSGDVVAYWRDQKWNNGKLSKGGRWYGSAVVIGHVGKNVIVAHRTHILRCAPEQVRMATSEEQALIADPENELLGIKDLIEGGTFRSSQYVDLLHQAYPPSDDVIMCPEGLEVEASALGRAVPAEPSVPQADGPDVPMHENSPMQPNDDSLPEQPSTNAEQAIVPDDSSEVVDKSPADNVPGSEQPSGSNASSSTYGPIRRIAAKTGPSALYRPMPVQHDDFVEVMREVLPQLLNEATRGTKREPSEELMSSEPKHAKSSDTHGASAVQHEVLACRHELSDKDAHELWSSFQQHGRYDVLVVQFMQKRAQKEIPHSHNEPKLQAQVDAAKVQEWNTLIEKQAVRLVPKHQAEWILKHQKHRIMGSRFVIVKKAMEDVIENGMIPDPSVAEHWKVKARFCLQGHLDPDLSHKATQGLLQSPTLSQIGRTVLFQMMATHRWKLQLGDVKGAFLEAGPIPKQYRPLYAWIPPGGIPGAENYQLVEVLGNVYGQNDAPAAWYKVFDQAVLQSGFHRSKYDPCLYFMRDPNTNKLIGVLGSHVDDTATAGEGPLYQQALDKLKHRFPYRKWRTMEGEFCGSHYKQDESTMAIVMTQQGFADGLKPAYLPTSRRNNRASQLTAKEISVLRAINGSLNWLAGQTRPDLASQTSFSQQSFPAPTVHHLCEANNVIRRAKLNNDLGVKFLPIKPEDLRLVCHADAAFANVGSYTQAGYIIGFTSKHLDHGEKSPWTPAIWKSHRLSRAVGSTLAAEAQSMVTATGTLEWASLILSEALDGPFDVRTYEDVLKYRTPVIVTDCKSLFDHLVSVSSPTAIEDRRTSIDIVILRQSILRMQASVRWVPTNRMLADSLTKNAGDPTDLLRACVREGMYQISPEEDILQMQAQERQRRLNK